MARVMAEQKMIGENSHRPLSAPQNARRGDSFLTQSAGHAVSGDENCLMRTVQAGPQQPSLFYVTLKFEIFLFPA
jgi:hypothetical protein